MSLISIITTTYKHAAFIERTIESVLAQTFTDWEMLIGDDNSPDGTYEIAKVYVEKDSRIKVWKNMPNLGLVNNMNSLLEKVSPESEYIAFLEGDDMFTPDNLAKKVEVFEKNVDLGLVYSDIAFINAKDEVLLPSFFTSRSIPFFQNIQLSASEYIGIKQSLGPISSYSTGMIRTSVLKDIKSIQSINTDPAYAVSDYDFYFRIATKYQVYGISESLTLYRRHDGNLSAKNIKLFEDLELLLTKYLQEGDIDSRLYGYKMAYISVLKAIAHLNANERKKAFSAWKNIWKNGGILDWCFYKAAVAFFLLSPNFFNQFIFKRLIIR